VDWSPSRDAAVIIDQRRLPGELVYRELRTVGETCDAIRTLAVRGAPAIGVAGAMGLVASLLPHVRETEPAFLSHLMAYGLAIRSTRPTAVNLSWAIDRLLAVASNAEGGNAGRVEAMRGEATAICDEDRAMCRRLGELGADLIGGDAAVLTYCNAGALATAGIGTALAPVYVLAERGASVSVFSCESRPLLQGSRLTAWELARAGIPVTVLADGAAASLLRRGGISAVCVGADRIAANGDVANKIGTYALALAANRHGVPFYVFAPTSTVDPATRSGVDIVIEERDPSELAPPAGMLAPDDEAPRTVAVPAWNPAFDVTPAALVSAIVTDRAVHRAPYDFQPAMPVAEANR
jgi:methylthioribose-1-phosphate isomerase